MLCRDRDIAETVIADGGREDRCGHSRTANAWKGSLSPRGVKTIGEREFYGCERPKEISIPEGVEKIGFIAFANCKSLESVKLPATLK